MATTADPEAQILPSPVARPSRIQITKKILLSWALAICIGILISQAVVFSNTDETLLLDHHFIRFLFTLMLSIATLALSWATCGMLNMFVPRTEEDAPKVLSIWFIIFISVLMFWIFATGNWMFQVTLLSTLFSASFVGGFLVETWFGLVEWLLGYLQSDYSGVNTSVEME